MATNQNKSIHNKNSANSEKRSKIAFWNCCGGISGKISAAEHIIKSQNIEILFVSETEYDPKETWIHIPGYRTESTATHIYGKSRLIAFVKSSSCFIRSRSIKVSSDMEVLILETPKHRAIGVYKPFKHINGNTNKTYMSKLIEVLTEAAKTKKSTCLGGDFNINTTKHSSEKEALENWALEANMFQHINEHTWERLVEDPITSVKVLRKSMLDLIFTNCEGTPKVLDKFTSDHKCVTFEFSTETEKIIRLKTKRRTYKGYNPQIIAEKINHDLNEQSFTGNADFDADLLTNVVNDVMDYYHPLRTIRTSRPTDVVDQELEKIKKKRKRLLKKYNKDPSANTLSKIKQLNIMIKNNIKLAKQQQLNLRLEGKNAKSFWNAVAELEGKRKEENLILTINNMAVSNPQTLTEEFGDFFLSKVDKLSGFQTKHNYMIGHSSLNITETEI